MESFKSIVKACIEKKQGATLFGYEVKDPTRYGVVELNENGHPFP